MGHFLQTCKFGSHTRPARRRPKDTAEENDGQEHPNAGWLKGTQSRILWVFASLWISILVFVFMTQEKKNQEMIEQCFSQQGLFLELHEH